METHKWVRRCGVDVMVLGILILVGYGLWNMLSLFFKASDLPILIRVSTIIIFFGFIIFLYSFIMKHKGKKK
jgi:hypothetical protein